MPALRPVRDPRPSPHLPLWWANTNPVQHAPVLTREAELPPQPEAFDWVTALCYFMAVAPFALAFLFAVLR